MTAKGWTLSPTYDMNPTLNDYQSLLVTSTSNKADLSLLLDACEERKVTEGIIREIANAVKGWRSLAVRMGIPQKEMCMFAGVLNGRAFDSYIC